MKQCGLDLVQLHGEESSKYVNSFKGRAYKAFRAEPRSATSGKLFKKIKKYNPSVFLLDAYTKGKKGGTGKTFDLKIAKKARQLGNVILAGGLTPENVSRAVKKVKPIVVDVVSGVENSPGRKDYKKLKKFITQVKTCH